MEKLTAYRVYGNIIEDLHYSKVFYVDESQFDNEEEINDALEEMAREDWWESGDVVSPVKPTFLKCCFLPALGSP